MQTITDTTGGHQIRKTNKRLERLSPDGLWRAFPKAPGLLQYVKSGMFYGRAKAQGKLIRQSLKTDVYSTAKLKLADFLKTCRTRKHVTGSFSAARATYEQDLEASHEISPETKRYRGYCIKRLLASWPELDARPLARITAKDCKQWATRFSQQVDETYFNNTLGTLRAILKAGGVTDNPAMVVKRLGVNKTVLTLPEPGQFKTILELIETAGARQSKDCADLVRFLAFSGCRISEAKQVLWRDVNTDKGFITVHNAKLRRSQNGDELRQVPIISEMAVLLERLRLDRQPKPEDKVNALGECQGALTRACRLAGVARITHHDLRHLFASVCIESGVDIPTVSRWLGHRDGGALAMRVYGHLRVAHSVEMARRVTFNKADADNVVALPQERVA